jgi:hypothetical protein
MFLAVALFAGCATAPQETGSSASDVVGGVADSNYPATGYLLVGTSKDTLAGPNCGATLISPRVAVTASHCIVIKRNENPNVVFGISFGEVNTRPVYPALVTVSHPGFTLDGELGTRYPHDVAILILEEPIIGVLPVKVLSAPKGQNARYVGYGRTTPGDYNVMTGYTNERKGTVQTVTDLKDNRIYVKGVDGGLCWGDSGGPLMDPATGNIYGVLSDFATSPLQCSIGNEMIFTDLTTQTDFLDQAVRCSEDSDPAKCMANAGAPAANGCVYSCNVHGYAESECRNANGKNWLCTDGCIKEVPTCDGGGTVTPPPPPPATTCHYPCDQFQMTVGQCQTNPSGSWTCGTNNCVMEVESCTNQVCKYPCATHSYAEGECRENGGSSWLCENGCIAQVDACAP